uniref:protein shortage in chiasmata 1 ortholog n=1 Tax=Myxine glutinosa TaxID=7769 RepID=UPI00358E98B0
MYEMENYSAKILNGLKEEDIALSSSFSFEVFNEETFPQLSDHIVSSYDEKSTKNVKDRVSWLEFGLEEFLLNDWSKEMLLKLSIQKTFLARVKQVTLSDPFYKEIDALKLMNKQIRVIADCQIKYCTSEEVEDFLSEPFILHKFKYFEIEQPKIVQTVNDQFNYKQVVHCPVYIQTNHIDENPKARRSCSATPLESDDINISELLHTTCTNEPERQLLCEELNQYMHAQNQTYKGYEDLQQLVTAATIASCDIKPTKDYASKRRSSSISESFGKVQTENMSVNENSSQILQNPFLQADTNAYKEHLFNNLKQLQGQTSIFKTSLAETLPVNVCKYATEHDTNNGVKDNAVKDACNPLIDLKIPHVVKISEKVIDYTRLLVALETRTYIQVVDRNYAGIAGLVKTNHSKFSADLIINENTAVIVQDFVSLTEGNTADNAMYHLAALSLQFASCWLIVFPLSDKGYLHDTSLAFVKTMSYIHAASTCFFNKKEGHIKILTAGTVEDAADIIRAIADCSMH